MWVVVNCGITAFFGAPWVYFSTLRAQRTKKFENHCILTKHDAHYIYVCTSVGELFNTPIPYNVTKILITHVLYFNIGYVHELFIFFFIFLTRTFCRWIYSLVFDDYSDQVPGGFENPSSVPVLQADMPVPRAQNRLRMQFFP